MELPSFLFDQATTISRPAAALLQEAAPAPAKARQNRAALVPATVLNFSNAQQQQTNWCWAAVSSAVSFYYNGASFWTQCNVASAQLTQNCCVNPVPCNKYGYLDAALQTTGNYNGPAAAPAPAAYLDGQFMSGRPVCIRVAWNGGGAHFLTLYGLANGVVAIADPWYGYSTATLASFPGFYQGGATWTTTFATKA